jgi:hypothetical protein
MFAGERTETYIRWKFLQDPDEDNKIYAAFDETESRLLAYIIYSFRDNYIEIRDFIVGQHANIASTLMADFLSFVKKTYQPASVVISILNSDSLVKRIKAFGFRPGKSSGNIYFYCNNQLLSQFPKLTSANNWLLMHSDQDT